MSYAAEKQLLDAQEIPGYPLQVLRLVASADPNNSAVRLAAAIHFKNIVKKGWDVNREVSIILFVILAQLWFKSNELFC